MEDFNEIFRDLWKNSKEQLERERKAEDLCEAAKNIRDLELALIKAGYSEYEARDFVVRLIVTSQK